jgi:single-strand DNA-binding protein
VRRSDAFVFLYEQAQKRAAHAAAASLDSSAPGDPGAIKHPRGKSMNSFKLTAIGNLAKNPELVAKGDVSYTRFCVIGNDFAGKDEDGNSREVVTSVWFVAFGALGEAIANNTRKGDQLILDARIRSNNWIDPHGEKQYDYSFVVDSFRLGAPGRAKREELELRELRRDGDASRSALSSVG